MSTATKNSAPGELQLTAGPHESGRDLRNTTAGTPERQAPKPITLEVFGEARDYFHAPSGKFIFRMESGRWLPLHVADFKRHLRDHGLKAKPDEGRTQSEVDKAILDVQHQRDVSYFGPLCGRNSGFIEENGNRILVTEDMQLPIIRKGSWPNLRRVIHGLLAESEDTTIGQQQVDTFHGWMKSSVEALRARRFQQQQALAVCGPPGCGKSFLQNNVITPALTGRAAKAERYFSGKTDFNADLFAAEHLVLEDEHCSTRHPDRMRLGSSIKQHTVNLEGSLHCKGRTALTLRGWWRVSITLNDDPEAMMVLPPLDEQFADKLILLRASAFTWPMPMETTDERFAFRDTIRAELSGYLHWLIHEWTMPSAVRCTMNRYNVGTYHHPEMMEALQGFAPEAELHELLEIAFADRLRHGVVEATHDEIERAIRQAEPERANRLFTFRNACATYLGRLAKKHPKALERDRSKTNRWWRIHRELFS